jgi:FkbM family methyltransferase
VAMTNAKGPARRLVASAGGPGLVRAKRFTKDWLRRAGLEVSLAGKGPRRSLPQVLAHVRRLGVAPATVIDVGVEAGTPELYRAFPNADLLLVEPMEEWQSRLDQLGQLGGARRVHVEIAAAGRSPGEATLYVHRVPALSSLLGARVGDAQGAQARRVPVITVDALVERHGFAPPYVLKVDVEGGELEVLAGATQTLRSSELVLLEVPLFRVVPESPQLADVVWAMRELGWSVYDIYDGNVRPLDGALALVDIAFARDDGILRARHDYATPEQADELYRSWGY